MILGPCVAFTMLSRHPDKVCASGARCSVHTCSKSICGGNFSHRSLRSGTELCFAEFV